MHGQHLAFDMRCHHQRHCQQLPKHLVLSNKVLVHFPCNDEAHDFIGALKNGVYSQIPQDPLHRIVLQIAIPVHQRELLQALSITFCCQSLDVTSVGSVWVLWQQSLPFSTTGSGIWTSCSDM